MTRYTKLTTAERYAAEQGYILTAEDWQSIMAAQKLATARKAAIVDPEQGRAALIQRFNRHYPRLLKALHGTGDVALTLAQTFIVAFGVPLTLVLLLIVEQERVQGGVGLFEVNAALAAFAAWALVILNLVTEFVINHIETKSGYRADPATRFSLRIWARRGGYVFGLARGWSPIALSPAQRFRALRRVVTLAILALALAGSMHDVIIQAPGAWYDALLAVVTRSTLLQAATWAGGLAFAFAAVLSAQGLSRYVAVRCVEILAAMNALSNKEKHTTQAEIEAAAAQYVIAKVNKWKAAQLAVSAVSDTLKQPKQLSPEQAAIVEYFTGNQDKLKVSSHKLADETPFAQATIYRVQKAIESGAIPFEFSANGHTKEAQQP